MSESGKPGTRPTAAGVFAPQPSAEQFFELISLALGVGDMRLGLLNIAIALLSSLGVECRLDIVA